MRHSGRALIVSMLVAGAGLQASTLPERFGVGFQAGAAVPATQDLTVAAGTGFNLGAHLNWDLNEDYAVRPRLDLMHFAGKHQDATAPLMQHIDTQVQGVALGAEFLFLFDGPSGVWSFGPGVYAARWSVKSTNRITVGTGTVSASGTSSWTRPAVGITANRRLRRGLELEARWLFSHYGYQDSLARVITAGIVWRF